MRLLRNVGILLITFALALMVGAQEPEPTPDPAPADQAETAEDAVAGIVESDSREALEFFIDWASMWHRVQIAVDRQGTDLGPEGSEWGTKALRNLKVEQDRVVIPLAGANPQYARRFAEAVFHVFEETVFRDFCLDRLNAELAEIEYEARRQELETITRIGSDNPQAAIEALSSAQNEAFQLELQRAEAEARNGALRRQLEDTMEADEQYVEAAPEFTEYTTLLGIARSELERLKRLKEKLGTQGNQDIEVAQARILEIEARLASLVAQREALQARGQTDDLGAIRAMIIEAEAMNAGLANRMELLQQRIVMLASSAEAARESLMKSMELDARGREIERAYEQVREGRVFGVRGIPSIHFR